jgi:hypothetical protein
MLSLNTHIMVTHLSNAAAVGQTFVNLFNRPINSRQYATRNCNQLTITVDVATRGISVESPVLASRAGDPIATTKSPTRAALLLPMTA